MELIFTFLSMTAGIWSMWLLHCMEKTQQVRRRIWRADYDRYLMIFHINSRCALKYYIGEGQIVHTLGKTAITPRQFYLHMFCRFFLLPKWWMFSDRERWKLGVKNRRPYLGDNYKISLMIMRKFLAQDRYVNRSLKGVGRYIDKWSL